MYANVKIDISVDLQIDGEMYARPCSRVKYPARPLRVDSTNETTRRGARMDDKTVYVYSNIYTHRCRYLIYNGIYPNTMVSMYICI